MYVLDEADWDDCDPALVVGAGYRLAVGWSYEQVTFVGILAEVAPFADPEDGDEGRQSRIVWEAANPLHLLNVDELESALDVELPQHVREQLERDQREHYEGRAGESVEELTRRIRELAERRREELARLEAAGARWNRIGELEIDGVPLVEGQAGP